MACRCKVRFKQFGRGWTMGMDTTHESAKSAVEAILGQKSKIIRVHDKGTFIKWVSASKVGARDRWRTDVNLNPTKDGANFTADADEVATAARVRLYADNGASRFLWFRGLADTAVKKTSEGEDIPDGAWLSRLEALIDVLGGQGANLAVRSLREAVGAYRYINVTNIAATPNTGKKNTTFTLSEAPTFAVGQRVIFTRPGKDVLLLPYRNSHRVIDVDNDLMTFTINASYMGPDAGYQPDGMRARWEDYEFLPVTGGNFVTFGKRDTGPDITPRGREPGVSYRHS